MDAEFRKFFGTPENGKKNAKLYQGENQNPFYLKQEITKLQMLKMCLMAVVLPLKLLAMLLVLTVAWILCVITLVGLPQNEAEGTEPLSGWRRRWAKPFLSRLCRLAFFLGGYLWVPQRGRRAPKEEAPILLVAPHSSFLDTALVTVLHCPGLVVRDYTTKAPFFGDLIRYTQPLYVGGSDRRRISEAIRDRVTSEKDFEQLMLFPEGGCGNRKAMLQFKLGAFIPGVPVQPVFVRYTNSLDTITWTWDGPGLWNQLWMSLTQFRIYCELEFLPVYKPSEAERRNPRLFANNVQRYVSSWTGCPVSPFAAEDGRFIAVARNLRLPFTASLVKSLRERAAQGHKDRKQVEEMNHLQEKNCLAINSNGEAKKKENTC